MDGINFFGGGGAPDPQADPQGFARAQNMARALMSQGTQGQQGQMVGGHYVAPSAGSYVNQIASAVAGGQQMRGLQEARRASTILNGGEVAPRTAGWLGGLFGAGGG